MTRSFMSERPLSLLERFPPNSAELISLGDTLVGFSEPSSGDTANAQLVSWRKASFEEWRMTAENTIPASPMGFSF